MGLSAQKQSRHRVFACRARLDQYGSCVASAASPTGSARPRPSAWPRPRASGGAVELM